MSILPDLAPIVTTLLEKGGPPVAYLLAFALGTALNLLILGIFYVQPLIEIVRDRKDGSR